MRITAIILVTALFTWFLPVSSWAQESKKEKRARKSEQIRKMVENKRFVFQAQRAQPMGGGSWQLTSPYDFTMKGDTAVCFLPYFGRAFVAPINPSEGGIKFTSTKFSYDYKKRRKGGWDITFKPQDVDNLQFIMINISEAGYGSLQVTDNTRQPISFDGVFEPK